MIDRRYFIRLSSFVIPTLCGVNGPAWADGDALKSASVADVSPISEKLLYSTVRLSERIGNSESLGTGFYFQLLKGAAKCVPVIVTNKHVVENMQSCSFCMHKLNQDGSVHKTEVVSVTLPDFRARWIAHPTEDLAVIPIGDILKRQDDAKEPVYVAWTDQSLIPTNSILESLNPLEEILTVGFPGTFYDTLHNIPLFHIGHTSTPCNMPFETSYDGGRRHSKQTFLVDVATWPGSSGSPVFIFNEHGYSDRKGNHFLGGERLLLIGVVFGVANQEVRGKVNIQSIPNESGEETLSIPINVGACLLASQILDFEDVIISRGFVPPEGYQRRT